LHSRNATEVFNIGRRYSASRRPEFPPVETADVDGLLMLGGELSPAWMLEGYRRGIFAWPLTLGRREALAWFSPDPRAIFELDGLHVSRSLERRLRSGRFEIRHDSAFEETVAACARPRHRGDGVWITPSLRAAYRQLHDLGHAHSVEAWREGRLVGGVFGIAVGGLFAAESMFHRETDASKVALVHLVNHLRRQGFALLDIQVITPHTASLGAIEIPREDYLKRLKPAVELPVSF
jgi:leucyl/phenylalanyl-tRNA---protein transferase